MKMGLNKNILRLSTLIAVVGTFGSACVPLQALTGSKQLDSGVAPAKKAPAKLSEPGVVFKEVPYGDAVGTVVVPSFQTATAQIIDTLGIERQTGNVRGAARSATG